MCAYIESDEVPLAHEEEKRHKPEVTFHPSIIVSQSPRSSISHEDQQSGSSSIPGIVRCISIPNKDLDDVQYEEEEDQDCQYIVYVLFLSSDGLMCIYTLHTICFVVIVAPYGSISFTVFYQEAEQELNIELLTAQVSATSLMSSYLPVLIH